MRLEYVSDRQLGCQCLSLLFPSTQIGHVATLWLPAIPRPVSRMGVDVRERFNMPLVSTANFLLGRAASIRNDSAIAVLSSGESGRSARQVSAVLMIFAIVGTDTRSRGPSVRRPVCGLTKAGPLVGSFRKFVAGREDEFSPVPGAPSPGPGGSDPSSWSSPPPASRSFVRSAIDRCRSRLAAVA